MKYSNPDIFLRGCQADAYAMGTEFLDPVQHARHIAEALLFRAYLPNPGFTEYNKGEYSDDGQGCVGVGEVLLITDEPTEEMFADSFVRVFKRDPRVGYAKPLFRILNQVGSGEELRKAIDSRSDSNGGAMRAPPVGVLKTPERVLEVAALQACITHNTPNGILAAQAVALMSHFALYQEDGFDRLIEYCLDYLPQVDFFRKPWYGPVTRPDIGIKTAHAVCTLLTTHYALIPLLAQTICWGGDTDTVAAISWGIASARFCEPLPDFFERDLERGRNYGPAFLKELGKQLMTKYE